MRTKLLYLLISTFAFLGLSACGDDEYPMRPGDGALIVSLSERPPGLSGGLVLYVFNAGDDVVLRNEYADHGALGSDFMSLPPGEYAVVVVGGVPSSMLPSILSPQELIDRLNDIQSACPGMMTAMDYASVEENSVSRLSVTLQDGLSGMSLVGVRLLLDVPGPDLDDYVPVRSGGMALRCVLEANRDGDTSYTTHREIFCTPQSDGTFLAELSLMPGDYDLRLWADWNGGYYNTDDLGKVLVLTDSYVANGETDKKDAYYATSSISVASQSSPAGGVEGASVSLVRPFAKYRLIATDVEAYYNLIDKGEALPDIEDLQVRVTYEGFFPTGFNVATGKPNDALNTGIHYTSVPTVAEGYDAKVNRQVGADFVLTNGEESFVNVTIQMIDTNTGDIVATVQHVKIPYKRGHLTTVTGHFLTAGKTPGGVQIDTEWGEDIVIEF